MKRLFALLTLTLLSGVALAGSQSINIPNRPLVSGTHVSPNVLVGFDNSSSMHESLLFYSSGSLYWNYARNCGSIKCGGKFTDSDGGFFKNDGTTYYPYSYKYSQSDKGAWRYGQLFPQAIGKKAAVPPWPTYAFARSPDYNNLYFNPTTTYKPWPGRKPASQINTINSVPYNANQPAGPLINLAPSSKIQGSFEISAGMRTTYGGTVINAGNGAFSNGTYGRTQQIKYFPATFYLKASSKSGARTKAGHDFRNYLLSAITKVKSVGPVNGANPIYLYRFRIRPDNFSGSGYGAAIDNFANWFTYHRTRSGAVKNAITRSFKHFSDLNVGTCSINSSQVNNSGSINVYQLFSHRSTFNSTILNYAIQNNKRDKTPLSRALNYLGQRYKNQKGLIQSPCQKNYVILFTDGYNNIKFNNVSPKPNDDDNDGVSKPTLGDLGAKYFYDLNPTYISGNGQVKTRKACQNKHHNPRLDCNQNLHVDTFGVVLGHKGFQFGTSSQPNPYKSQSNWSLNQGTNIKANVKTSIDPIWPSAKDLYTQSCSIGTCEHSPLSDKHWLDDLWHATVNSRGSLLNTYNPQQLQNKFTSILNTVLNRELTASSIAINQKLASSSRLVYSGTFRGRQGHLRAYSYGGNTIPNLKGTPSAPGWQAINGNITNPSARNIFTRYQGTNKQFNKSSFSPSTKKNLNLTNAKIQYLRGSTANSGTKPGDFRYRNGDTLGAIINSKPVYSYPRPEFTGYIGAFSNAPSYRQFALSHSGRTPTVFVEANDGMLHAFNAGKKSNGGGNEEFAYIPASVLPKIHGLTQQAPPREFYADATPTVGDGVVNGQWATVLVAGERAGSNSIFALNVTQPSNFSKSDVLWEDSNATKGISELGKTYSKPQIVRLNNGDWAAIFGNGYNSPDNDAVLYIVNLSNGQLIKKFVVSNKNISTTRSGPDGLSTPEPADLNGDYKTDYVYAGDLHGNMWRFNLSSSNKSNWTATKLYTTSKNKQGNPRPITSAPLTGLGPSVPNGNRGIMVYFGSGKYLERSDITASNAQSKINYMYGIWDSRAGSSTSSNNFSNIAVSSGQLAQQQISSSVTQNGNTYSGATNVTVNYKHSTVGTVTSGTTTKTYYRGWRLNFGPDGERVINQPHFDQNLNLVFTTSIPSIKACVSGGSGYLYRVDRYSGGATTNASFDVNGDGQFTSADKVFSGSSSAVRVKTNNGMNTGSLGVAGKNGNFSTIVTGTKRTSTYLRKKNSTSGKQVSWRQIRRGG